MAGLKTDLIIGGSILPITITHTAILMIFYLMVYTLF